MEDKTQLQWLLAGIGVMIVALIYLWGIRARLKEEIRKRRRRSTASEPKLGETGADFSEAPVAGHEIRELGRVTPDHHLADKILVDVEIRSIPREDPPGFTPSPKEWPPVSNQPLEPKEAIKAFAAKAPPVVAPVPAEALNGQGLGEGRLDPRKPARPKMTVALTILAPRHQLFKGLDVQVAAEEAGFVLGETGLFERYPEEASSTTTPVFSLAHLLKPGAFQPEALAELNTPGLLIFMTLPGPIDSMKALDLLVFSVDQVARQLGGVICDEYRHKLTNQGLISLRDKVARWERTAR